MFLYKTSLGIETEKVNYVRAEMTHDPCEFEFDKERGTNMEHEVVEENITNIGTTPEWTSFRDNLSYLPCSIYIYRSVP